MIASGQVPEGQQDGLCFSGLRSHLNLHSFRFTQAQIDNEPASLVPRIIDLFKFDIVPSSYITIAIWMS